MAKASKGAPIIAILMAGAVIGWLATGEIIEGGQENSDNATPPPAERAGAEAVVQNVRYVVAQEQNRQKQLAVRGRTEATATVTVRAETSGIVLDRPVKKGQVVEPGQMLCKLDEGVREATISQAKASLAQANVDYDAHAELEKQGFATSTRLLALKAAQDQAMAALEQAELDFNNTTIKAKTAGIIHEPITEIGNRLNTGDVCVTLIQTDPMKFIGEVSERDIKSIALGDSALINLITNEKVEGNISYISPSANPATRTFKIEVAMPNPDNKILDGLTASAAISLASEKAFEIKPSWLTLNNAGDLGVRTITQDESVEFVPIAILAQTTDTMWVNGLTEGQRIITVGHEYVETGQKVRGVNEADLAKELMENESMETEGANS